MSKTTKDDVIESLMVACPTFSPVVDACLEFYKSSPGGEVPHYMLMGELVIECSKRMREGTCTEFRELFDLLEDWIENGDEFVVTLAVTGFIEDLQNSNLHEGSNPQDFKSYLKPKSSAYWEKVDRFWNNRELITKL